jgi:hypothetical protein
MQAYIPSCEKTDASPYAEKREKLAARIVNAFPHQSMLCSADQRSSLLAGMRACDPHDVMFD